MIKRIFAFIIALLLLALVIITFICGITGSQYFIGMLFLCIVVPVLCYAIALVARLLRHKGEEMELIRQTEENQHAEVHGNIEEK